MEQKAYPKNNLNPNHILNYNTDHKSKPDHNQNLKSNTNPDPHSLRFDRYGS